MVIALIAGFYHAGVPKRRGLAQIGRHHDHLPGSCKEEIESSAAALSTLREKLAAFL
jgi:hypothetical protein